MGSDGDYNKGLARPFPTSSCSEPVPRTLWAPFTDRRTSTPTATTTTRCTKGAEFAIYNANPNTDANATVVRDPDPGRRDRRILLERGRDLVSTLLAGRTRPRRFLPSCPQPLEFKLTPDGSGTTVELAADATDAAQVGKGATPGAPPPGRTPHRRNAGLRHPRPTLAPTRPPGCQGYRVGDA